ncbi:MAG: PorT family protein [Bacteroidales bacterium]|nr:PorT family protein [Bacteroidales bacterium]
MKRNAVTIAIIVWAGFLALSGQIPSSLGVKAGLSLANQSYRFTPIDYTLETEPVVGPAFSLFVEAFRGAHFTLQVDLSYAVKGSRSSTQSVTVNHLDNDRITVNEGEKTKSTFSYLSLAPMARYMVGQGSLVPYFLLGPRVDILLKYSSGSEYPLVKQNGTILGLTCGAGVEFRLQKLGLFTELQYLPDISPVTSEEPLLINNNMISLTMGIRWFPSE